MNPVHGARTIKGRINEYIELQKPTLDHIAARNIRISLEVKLWRLRNKMYDGEYMIPVIRIYILYLQTVLLKAGPSVT